jgi:hypothetical protein
MNSKKLSMFERGSDAAARVLGTRDCYVCPLCTRTFTKQDLDSGLLTLEHVPPRSLGGKAIALTCRTCNNAAGSSLDAEIYKRHEQRRFAQMIVGRDINYKGRAKLKVGEDDVHVEVSRTPDNQVTFNIIGSSNDPAAVLRVNDYLDGLSKSGNAEGTQFRITSLVRYHHRRSQIGYLRAAYLVAFASLGYKYALSTALDGVRDQIHEPKSESLHGWMLEITTPDLPEFLFLVMESPNSLLVKFGTTGVFLPRPEDNENLYAKLRSEHSPNDLLNVSGAAVAWPTSLRLEWDFAEYEV